MGHRTACWTACSRAFRSLVDRAVVRVALPVPTRRLAVLTAAMAVVAVALPFGLVGALLVINAGLILAALVDWLLAIEVRLVGVTREMPGSLTLGSSGVVVWRVSNGSRRDITVGLCDELVPSLHPGDRRAVIEVPAGATEAAMTTISPSRRGRFEPSVMTLRVEGPLGLVARQASRDVPGLLRVNPRFRSREEAELRINRTRMAEVGLRSTRGHGGGTEFDSLRDYTVDDEMRRIDWAATARAGRAIVRTYRAERNQQVMCLLDCGRTMAARIENEPRIEHAMDAVMMLTHVATRLGDRAGLVAFDAEVRAIVAPGHAVGRLQAVTEAMFTLEPRLVESDYQGAFVATLARFRRRSMLVLFSDLAEQAVTESLLPALPLIARDHVVVVAAVADPAVQRWATGEPLDAEGVYQKAAAIAAIEERRRVTFRLRRLGVTVVDAPPGSLAPRLADAYLEVKGTGRL